MRGVQTALGCFASLVLLAAPTLASADEDEARWTMRPLGGVAIAREAETGLTLAPGGGLSAGMAFGLTHQLDLGAEVVALQLTAAEEGAKLVHGDIARGEFQRRTSSALVLLGPTWRFGAPYRWTPTVSVAVGGGVRYRSAGVFSDLQLMPPGERAVQSYDVALSTRAGVERRLSRRVTIGTYASILTSWNRETPTYALASLSVGLSYVHYPLW